MTRTAHEIAYHLSGQRLLLRGVGRQRLLAHAALQFQTLDYLGADLGAVVSSQDFERFFEGRPNAGFVHLLHRLAQGLGIRLELQNEIETESVCGTNLANPTAFESPVASPAQDPALMQMVLQHRRGLIRHGPGVSAAWLVAQIAMSYRDARIAVLLKSQSEADEMRHSLAQFGNFLDNSFGDDCPTPRVAVGSVADFENPALEFERRDIVLFPMARTALHENSRNLLVHPDCHFRLFGFLSASDHLAEEETAYVRGIFGFEELLIPRNGFRGADVKVLNVPFHPALSTSDPSSGWRFFDVEVWRNSQRNRLIARLAIDLNRGVRPKAMRSSLADCPDLVLPRNVIVLTDSVRHALNMQQRLTGWPVVTSQDVDVEGLEPHERESLRDQTVSLSTLSDRIIATVDGLARIPSKSDNVAIIWAGSGPSGPQIPWSIRLCPSAMGDQEPFILLVDLEERADGIWRSWRNMRMDAFRDRGYLPVTCLARDGRILRFIADRG
ncbi:MAG: hypothetical protein WCL32_20320 [Planctomycetota bacterium]